MTTSHTDAAQQDAEREGNAMQGDAAPSSATMNGEHVSTASTDASLRGKEKRSKWNVPSGQGNSGAPVSAREGVQRFWLGAILAMLAVIGIIVGVTLTRMPARQSASGAKRADAVTIALKLAPTNLDIRHQSGSALDQALIGNVYEGIVARNADNKVIPALAKSWDISSDRLTYTFHFHDGITFSNGDKLDAQDAAWSLQTLMSGKLHGAETLEHFQSAQALDPHTLQVKLSAPYSDLLWNLAGRAGLVFDKNATYDAKTSAIGSGSYLVKEFKPNDALTLKANAHYWGAHKPQTPTIVLRYMKDANAALNALKSGAVQVVSPFDPLLGRSLTNNAQYVVGTGEDADKYVLAFNMQGEKTADKRVRQAIRYALNHADLIASRGGADKPLGGPIPSLDPGYEDLTSLYPHDVAKAAALMKEAGYSPEHPLQLRLTYATVYEEKIGDQIKAQLKPIGIDVQVTMVEFSTWLQDVYKNHHYDLSLVNHTESHDFYHWADPHYYFGYDNPRVKELYQASLAASSAAESDILRAQAAKIVSEDAPADWLFNYRVTTAYAKGVKGYPLNFSQTLLPLASITYTPAA